MKRTLLLLNVLFVFLLPAQAQQTAALSGAFFIENRGQWPAEVRFLARLNGLDAWITAKGVTYDLYQNSEGQRHGQVVQVAMGSPLSDADRCAGLQPLPGHYNYFLGNDRGRWASGAGRYREAWVEDAASGTGLRWYFDDGRLRYDFVLRPGVAASSVRLRFSANTKASIDGRGDLVFETRFGQVRQSAPVAYQQLGDKKEPVPCRYIRRPDGSIGFAAAPSHPELPLVIDPIIYSTFFGSPGYDEGVAIAVDQFGETYVAGNNTGTTFPTTPSAYDQTQNGATDVFVMKLSQDGSSLVYCTLLGGAGNDRAAAVFVDNSGSTYITGSTQSTNFPVSTLAYDKTFNGGGADAFVTKLNTGGDALDYSTYVGGSALDAGTCIRVDAGGQALVGGKTLSSDFPVVSPTYGQAFNGGAEGFVLRLNANASSLDRSGFIGGANNDEVTAIGLGGDGTVYLGGYTAGGFTADPNAYQPAYGGGASDGFVLKLNAGLSARQYFTYLGGSGGDSIRALAVDPFGGMSVGGVTTSPNLPVTAGALDGSYSGSAADGFFARLEPSGAGLSACSYLGNKATVTSLAVDGANNFYLSGFTSDASFPVSVNAQTALYAGGSSDGFVCKVDPTGSALLYGSYLGGNGNAGNESVNGLVYDGKGTVYLTGITYSANFPYTAGAYSNTYAGDADAFVTKLNLFACPPGSAAAFSNAPICSGETLTLSATASNAALFEWTGPAGFQSLISTSQLNNVALANAGAYTVTAYDLNGCSSSDTVIVRVKQRPNPLIIRLGDSLTTGTYAAYQWYHNMMAIPSGGQFQTYQLPRNGAANGTYFVVVTDTNGCMASSQVLTITGLAVGSAAGVLPAGLHPNPTTGLLYFGLPAPVDAVLRDVQGRMVLQQEGAQSLNLSGLESGIYLLSLRERSSGRTFQGRVLLRP